MHVQGCRPPAIKERLGSEGITVSRRGVAKFLEKFSSRGTITRLPGSGRKSKIADEVWRSRWEGMTRLQQANCMSFL